MSNGLEAIHQELQRLQQEGVERIFVEEATLGQLRPVQGQAARAAKAEQAAPISDLVELAQGADKRAAKPVATTQATPGSIQPIPETPAQFELPEGDAGTRMSWLKERVENCPVCNQHLSENGKVVFGAGRVDADIFFCGEAPGADEEREGEPFVGKAGQLLTKIIQAMGLQREDVYIGNILKWRPEHDKPYGNRPPTIEEMNFCLPYLRAQIQIVQPKVIVALGNTAVTGLLGPDPNRRMGSVRGTWNEFEGTPVIITFHPSYLLRHDTLQTKRMIWEDMLQVMDKLGLSISEKQRGFFLPKA